MKLLPLLEGFRLPDNISLLARPVFPRAVVPEGLKPFRLFGYSVNLLNPANKKKNNFISAGRLKRDNFILLVCPRVSAAM